MAVGSFLEPLVVTSLLFGGIWVNRQKTTTGPCSHNFSVRVFRRTTVVSDEKSESMQSMGILKSQATVAEKVDRHPFTRPLFADHDHLWRIRSISLFARKTLLLTPNTAVFQHRYLSRLLRRYPFFLECWYWNLVYWIYQLGRAVTAITLRENTVDTARRHALQVIYLEKRLCIFWEHEIQEYFLCRQPLLAWMNWTYSFIHIPGTIAFLAWLYYYNTTCIITKEQTSNCTCWVPVPARPALYQARRRTMAVSNLLAFIFFTVWPCMPPRLLSDKSVDGLIGEISRSYGFVDTVHGVGGSGSIWTRNRFCNQYAAMPSLHFGYSFIIGLTIMTLPLSSKCSCARTLCFINNYLERSPVILSWRRVACFVIGIVYPLTILVAIIATGNHFILDAVAGAIICALGWWGNSILLNLLPIEDYLFWALRIHKPEHHALTRTVCRTRKSTMVTKQFATAIIN